jgi:hypothetical protein
LTDFDHAIEDAAQANNNNETVELDCSPDEIGFANAVVAEAAKEDHTLPLEDAEMFQNLIDSENDHLDLDDDSDDEILEESAAHASLLIATPSDIEPPVSPEASPMAPVLQPKRQPRSELRALSSRMQQEQHAQRKCHEDDCLRSIPRRSSKPKASRRSLFKPLDLIVEPRPPTLDEAQEPPRTVPHPSAPGSTSLLEELV